MNSYKVLLLAAGFGSRLQPLTDIWPKCLMPINKKPLLEYWLDLMIDRGVEGIVVNTHYHAKIVKTFLEREKYFQHVTPFHEPQLLGTAGTLQANKDLFSGHTVLLVHADNFCKCDFSAFENYHFNERPEHCAITMMTFNTDNPKFSGIVEVDESNVVRAFHEKVSNPPGVTANAAVYFLTPEVCDFIFKRPSISDFSQDVIPKFMGRIATWHNSDIHRDIGTSDSLQKAQSESDFLLYANTDSWTEKFLTHPIHFELERLLANNA